MSEEEAPMFNYCDCGDYCAWCRPDLCRPVPRVLGMTREEAILWAHAHAIEDQALRNEAGGQDAAELRRVAVNLGELAIVLESETLEE